MSRPAKKLVERTAGAFAALGDSTRLTLVHRLGDGQSRSVSDRTEGHGQTRQAVTKHLRVLEGAGLVGNTRVGRECLYTLQTRGVA